MKRSRLLVALALTAALIFALCVPASAFSAQLSSQSVTRDGIKVSIQPYNIDGSNYFKLRDVAAMLSGTGAKFSVGFNSGEKTMLLTTGKDYQSVGGELSFGKDASSTCVKSQWKLSVNGAAVACSAYNIDGSNYFKLRDLGSALGFAVDYDSKSATVLVTTGTAGDYKPDMTFSTTDQNGSAWDQSCFANYKLTMLNRWAYWCGPCCKELPDLQKLQDDYSAKGLQILGVMDGVKQDLAVLTEKGISYPNLYYVSGMADYLDVTTWPTTVFVDQNGKVVATYTGATSYASWANIIDGLLK